ncbi:hypothetical protein BDA96_02G151200 [Sorghum bicolor]|uniref:Uncharacterized protein n=2 Tax=Sorghum bicolor TaxID=4558 RepID=A0A921RPQ7_SORBI|nr:hypothetical protein BDA96_02G151200 [Sorghum bicolor]OQU89090.1 hypothetical protein SORBI_3002G144933 [Sorghum bicolor]
MMKLTLLLPHRATTSCSTPASTFMSTSSLSMPSPWPLDTKKVNIKGLGENDCARERESVLHDCGVRWSLDTTFDLRNLNKRMSPKKNGNLCSIGAHNRRVRSSATNKDKSVWGGSLKRPRSLCWSTGERWYPHGFDALT